MNYVFYDTEFDRLLLSDGSFMSEDGISWFMYSKFPKLLFFLGRL